MPPGLPTGVRLIAGALDQDSQLGLLADLREILRAAPLYTPTMPRSGRPFSVAMTNCGPLGWVSDKAGGYRYQACHPVTGEAWPAMPPRLIDLWRRHAGYPHLPEACLVNHYRPGARLGSHADLDEVNREAPVLSVSLGCDAVFHVGGPRRSDRKVRFILRSGDILVLGGPSRDAVHGIDRIVPDTSGLVQSVIDGGGRINLTMRRVTPA